MTVYRHISEAKKAKGPVVSLQCEVLGVSESGYWAWARRAPSDRALYDAWLTERIRALHAASGGRYGSPRVHAMLRREGIRVGEKRVARLMALAGLQGAYQRRLRRGCTTSVPGVEPFSDLVGRDFRPSPSPFFHSLTSHIIIPLLLTYPPPYPIHSSLHTRSTPLPHTPSIASSVPNSSALESPDLLHPAAQSSTVASSS